jgi:hypothetical protein
MRLSHCLTLALLAITTVYGTARAQQPDITGAWSFQFRTPQGPIASTVFIQPNGGFVRADRLTSGVMLRQWGQYRAQQTGPNSFRIDTQIQGYSPHRNCVAIPGFGQNCQAAMAPPQTIAMVLTVTSPSTIISAGNVWQRDLSGGLLNVQVPDTSVLVGNAPIQPNIQQPVMPQMHPYTTPNGPGNQMANAYHQQNQVWTDTNMRGCSIDQYGRRWGCQQ